MQVDLYHLYGSIRFSSFLHFYPIVLDVLKVWAESIGWQARVSICTEANVDRSTDAAAVGISVYTETAPAAYRVGAELRRRGKIVIFGGPHFRGSDTWDEAAPFCDVIVSSLCEDQWRTLLRDIADGRLRPHRQQPLYVTDGAGEFRYPRNFYHSLANRRWFQVPTVPTSIGCPYFCTFCSAFMQGKYLLRDIETIYNEVSHTAATLVTLCDATFGLNKRFTVDLMHALAPLRKKIGLEMTLGRLRDPEVLDALAIGGVKWLVVGIETLGWKLRKHGTVGLHDGLRRVIDDVHERGIMIQGNFICGFDTDGPEIFEQIYRFYEASELDAIMLNILTPYPNTAVHRELRREGRIFDTNWAHYDSHHVVYRPQQMTVDQLIDGYVALYQMLRRRNSIFREIVESYRHHGVSTESAVMIANNLYQKFDAVKKRRLLRANQREIAERRLAEPAPGDGADVPPLVAGGT